MAKPQTTKNLKLLLMNLHKGKVKYMTKNYLNPEPSKKRATREAFGETLLELLEQGENIVAVDADLTGSTTLKKLKANHADRLINVGIAEQNMIDVAAGLSLTGAVAFTGSFAVFGTGRCYDQIRNTVCYSDLNVKVCPTHAGISVGPDGGSHQMLEDIALMQVLPRMKVVVPSDFNSCKAALKLVEKTEGPAYVRMGRAKVPQVYSEDVDLRLGGSHLIKEGTDVSIFANGVEVNEAILAAEELDRSGISAEVIDLYSVKPLDVDAVVNSAKKTGRVVVCEEHSIFGGLCSVVSQTLAHACPCKCNFVAVKDHFGTSAEFDELLEAFGLNSSAIVEAARALM